MLFDFSPGTTRDYVTNSHKARCGHCCLQQAGHHSLHTSQGYVWAHGAGPTINTAMDVARLLIDYPDGENPSGKRPDPGGDRLAQTAETAPSEPGPGINVRAVCLRALAKTAAGRGPR